ncbi:MAG: glycosyltransferase family 2 protein [Proteobacteria bacterium]|nr:glycosyltransferase family 2 protein [Pseudomonadota bacterium]
MPSPELSVIVPTANEAKTLPRLLEGLARQRGLRLEGLVVDGGSDDGTPEVCASFAEAGLAVRVFGAARGRGCQMNVGAAAARAPDLLFLHADTEITEVGLLSAARDRMAAERARRGVDRVAGHFGLRFLRSGAGHEGAYYFYEAKTRLGRPECVNGDQGFWLSREYFETLGGFDESLPYLEDARLARRVFATGGWVTLPGWLATSARRFEAEGLRARQTLNALIRNFDVIGLGGFFAGAAKAYRQQARVGPLRLGKFARLAHRASRAEGPRRFFGYWWGTGTYVAANAWQIAFALDCRRNRRAGLRPGEGPTPWLGRYDRWGAPVVRSVPGRAATALLVALWFYSALVPRR